jgi:hypothetical protein
MLVDFDIGPQMVQKVCVDDEPIPYLNGQGVQVYGQGLTDGSLRSEEIGIYIFIENLMEGIHVGGNRDSHEKVQAFGKGLLDRGAMNGLGIPGKRLQINRTLRIAAEANVQIGPFHNDRFQPIRVRNEAEPVALRELKQIEGQGLCGPREFLETHDSIVSVLC